MIRVSLTHPNQLNSHDVLTCWLGKSLLHFRLTDKLHEPPLMSCFFSLYKTRVGLLDRGCSQWDSSGGPTTVQPEAQQGDEVTEFVESRHFFFGFRVKLLRKPQVASDVLLATFRFYEKERGVSQKHFISHNGQKDKLTPKQTHTRRSSASFPGTSMKGVSNGNIHEKV